jgi:hypothetical protein
VACLLCRRQFASPEQLQRHEKESKLHKENMILAVKAAADDVANQLGMYINIYTYINIYRYLKIALG